MDGLELDPGGIGKGYAIDQMVHVLKEAGITSALLSGGGSSIYGLGSPPGGDGWKVQIKNPKSPGKIVEELELRDESMSTSGNYEKFFYAGARCTVTSSIRARAIRRPGFYLRRW